MTFLAVRQQDVIQKQTLGAASPSPANLFSGQSIMGGPGGLSGKTKMDVHINSLLYTVPHHDKDGRVLKGIPQETESLRLYNAAVDDWNRLDKSGRDRLKHVGKEWEDAD